MTRPRGFPFLLMVFVLLASSGNASGEEASEPAATSSAAAEGAAPAAPAPAPPASPDEEPVDDGEPGAGDAPAGGEADEDPAEVPADGAPELAPEDEELLREEAVVGAEPDEERASWLDHVAGLGETDSLFSISRGPFRLGLTGSIRLLGVPFIQDPWASIEAGSIANAEGFRLRRARFGIEGDLTRWAEFELRFEHGDGGANVLDAYMSFVGLPLLNISAGALKVPFSRTMLLGSEYQTFLQRPYGVRLISPDRSLGVRIDGGMHWFSYAAGVFNGGGDYYRGDNNDGMLYAGRLAAHPLGPLPPGEITLPESLVFEIAGSYYYNQDATGDRHAAAGEAILRWSGLTVAGEFLWSTFRPAGTPLTDEGIEYGQTDRMAWFADVSYFILAGHLQIAVRYEGQLVSEAMEIRDLNDLWAISAAVNGYLLHGRIKLSLQYEHRHEQFDEQIANDYLALQLQGRI